MDIRQFVIRTDGQICESPAPPSFVFLCLPTNQTHSHTAMFCMRVCQQGRLAMGTSHTKRVLFFYCVNVHTLVCVLLLVCHFSCSLPAPHTISTISSFLSLPTHPVGGSGQFGGFLPAVKQIANVAALPGIVGHSIGLPDVHAGKQLLKGKEGRLTILMWRDVCFYVERISLESSVSVTRGQLNRVTRTRYILDLHTHRAQCVIWDGICLYILSLSLL